MCVATCSIYTVLLATHKHQHCKFDVCLCVCESKATVCVAGGGGVVGGQPGKETNEHAT